jgi:hypothetical protein
MPETEAERLVELIDSKMTELKTLCEGIDEQTAGCAPAGRWSPKQIISHLCGPEGKGLMPAITVFFEQDTPRIDLVAEDPFYSANRANMTLMQLIVEADLEYAKIAGFTSTLNENQLKRKAHIPLLKDSPLGEYPTLGAWIETIAGGHIDFHIRHLKEILQQPGK